MTVVIKACKTVSRLPKERKGFVFVVYFAINLKEHPQDNLNETEYCEYHLVSVHVELCVISVEE